MPSNTAAWLTAEKANPLEIKSAPYTPPGEHEIVVKNGAVAVNPVDWLIQAMGNALFTLEYPFILGSDSAGEVVEVGSAVTRFRKGDRVLGLALRFLSNKNSAFQEYTVLLDHMASKFPSSMSFEQASVIPLGLCTAACGMYQQGYLELQYPSVNPKLTGKTLIIWGGATSVGSNAIQLAAASGYEVITTASPKNFDYVKKLGASQVFDYNSKTIVNELVAALKDKTTAGVFCAAEGDEVFKACVETLLKTNGAKFIAACRLPPQNVPDGISFKLILGSALKDSEVSKVIFDDFLPQALAEGKFVAAPDPQVVGKGLDYMQKALDLQKAGVSAKKIVVSL